MKPQLNKQPTDYSQPMQIAANEANNTQISRTITENNKATLIGYYGNSKIGLFNFNNTCFIAITGHYNLNQPTSTAIWFPNHPNNLFIFSRVITLDKATNFMLEKNNFQYSQSKSFIFIENKLYPLIIISLNNEKYAVYLFATEKGQTEYFIRADYFLGQFYHFNEQPGMTTIKFDLDGFTEALAAYNKFCDKN